VDFDGFLSGTEGCGDEEHRRLNGITCGGCAVTLGVKPACSALDVQLSSRVIVVELNVFCLPSIRTKFSRLLDSSQ